MSVDDDVLVPMLDRYIAGECSAAEAADVRALLSSEPSAREAEAVLSELRLWRDVAARRASVCSAREAWQRAARELALPAPAPAGAEDCTQPDIHGGHPAALPSRRMKDALGRASGSRLRQTPSRALGYAAAGVAAALAILGVAWQVARRAGADRRTPAAVSTYVTGNGERATVTLPDGSTIALNVGSRVDVAADYAAGHRVLTVHGEALFTVAHRDGAPFTVIVGSTTARALGTSFLVRHYATDTATTIAVRDGKVAVHSLVLTAAQAAEIGPGGSTVTRPADPAEFSFATGTLTLGGIPLPAAIPELDRWYNADIRLGDSTLAWQRIKGTFAAGSLADLTELLEFVYDVRVVREGRQMTLYPRTKE